MVAELYDGGATVCVLTESLTVAGITLEDDHIAPVRVESPGRTNSANIDSVIKIPSKSIMTIRIVK